MSEMIERVAESIRLRSIARGNSVHPVSARHLAVAAIEAMREPTREMDDLYPPGADKAAFLASYRAMIDEALMVRGPLRPAGSADEFGVPRAEEE